MTSYWTGKKRDKKTREKISAKLKGGGSLYKHGLSQTKLADIYYAAKGRCINKNDPRYTAYGGRGIKSVEDFYKDMKPTYKIGLQLDRIDNNGDYCKENCRWATRKQQQNNMRNNVRFTLSEICEAVGLSKHLVEVRLLRGWTLKEAIKLDKDCPCCDGKGYGTTMIGTQGYEDFGGKGFIETPTVRVSFCSCPRGKQLRELFGKAKTI